MKEKTYTSSCPVHKQILTTKSLKSVRMKKTDSVYRKPIFYCDKCKEHYIFVEEIGSGFKSKVVSGDGSIIWILGTKKVEEAPANKRRILQDNKNDSSGISSSIVRAMSEGIIKTNIVLSGSKLPKTCEKCKTETMVDLKYLVRDSKGKVKEVHGKECRSCGEIYFPETIVDQHKDCFTVINAEIKAEDRVSPDVKNLFVLYLNAKKKTTIGNLRKQLVNTKEDIEGLLKHSLHQGKETDEKILYIGMRKYPCTFLSELWDIYKDDKVEFASKIKPFDFNKGQYYLAAVNLLNTTDVFPSSILAKLQGNVDFQYLIREEVQKGKVFPSYIKFLSSNLDIILEPWLQNELVENISSGNHVDDFVRYVDLNSEIGMDFVNSQKDYIFINYLFERNIWNIDIDKKNLLSKKVQAICNLRDKGMVDKELKEYIDDVVACVALHKNEHKDEAYYEWLFKLVCLLPECELAEKLYIAYDEQQVQVDKYEMLLAQRNSELMLEVWLRRVSVSDLTIKHSVAKKIISMYPEYIDRLVTVIEECNIDKLSDNLKEMAQQAGLEWRKETQQTSVYIVEDMKNQEGIVSHDENEGEDNKDVSSISETFTDDFGNEFDLSELTHLLNLK